MAEGGRFATMLKKENIHKTAGMLFSICGGWWGIMSSVPSIPLAFLALFSNGTHQKWWFALSAIIALWIFAISVVVKNHQLTEKLEQKQVTDIRKREIRTEFTRLHGELKIARQFIQMDMAAYQAKYFAAQDPTLAEIFKQIQLAFIKYFDGTKYVLFIDDSAFPNFEPAQRGTAMAEITIHRLNQYITRLGKIIEESE